jgi:hypothetical protein
MAGLLPTGGMGNLIAAPLFRPARQNGRTLFLDLATLEPHKDQWAYLSTLGRIGRSLLSRQLSARRIVQSRSRYEDRFEAATVARTRPGT